MGMNSKQENEDSLLKINLVNLETCIFLRQKFLG